MIESNKKDVGVTQEQLEKINKIRQHPIMLNYVLLTKRSMIPWFNNGTELAIEDIAEAEKENDREFYALVQDLFNDLKENKQ